MIKCLNIYRAFFESSIVNVYGYHAIALCQTLIGIEGVFAKDAFDIGCFSDGIK